MHFRAPLKGAVVSPLSVSNRGRVTTLSWDHDHDDDEEEGVDDDHDDDHDGGVDDDHPHSHHHYLLPCHDMICNEKIFRFNFPPMS